MKKVLVVSIVLLLVTFIMAETTIVFWHHESPAHRVAAFQKVIDLFEQEYPDIKVVQQVVPWDDAYTKTLAAINAGTTPDFQFSLPDLTITAYQANGIIPLGELIEEIDEKYDFIDSQLEPYMINGNYWGIPIWTMPMVLIYRPSIIEKYLETSELPKNWNELLLAAQKITLKAAAEGEEIYGIGLTAGNNLCTQEQVYTIMANVGVELFDENGNLTFNSPETLRAVEFYKDLFKFSPPGATGWAWGEIEMNFAAGKIAMMPYFGGLQKRFFDMGIYDLDGVPQPFPIDGQRSSLVFPNDIHVFKSAKEKGHLEEVYEFIRFIMRPEINAILTAQTEPGSFVPVTVAAQESDAYWNDPIINQFEHLNRVIVDEIEYGKLYGFETGSVVNLAIGSISGANLLAEMIQNVVTEKYTIEEAVSNTTERMREFLEE